MPDIFRISKIRHCLHPQTSAVADNTGRGMSVVCECICIDSTSTSAVIHGLKPYTSFRFAVRSHAGAVFGLFGNEIRCRTAEGRKYYVVLFCIIFSTENVTLCD